MTPRKRSQDLTADLLRDLEAEEAAPTLTAPAAATPPTAATPPAAKSASKNSAVKAAVARTPRSSTTKPAPHGSDPAPSLETAVYLAPRNWRRPAVSRAGRSVSITAGPLRLRIGRRPA